MITEEELLKRGFVFSEDGTWVKRLDSVLPGLGPLDILTKSAEGLDPQCIGAQMGGWPICLVYPREMTSVPIYTRTFNNIEEIDKLIEALSP